MKHLPLQKSECNLHTYSLSFVHKMYANISMHTRYSNFGPNVHILMFANCMQTVDHIPQYVICLHANAICIYTVYIQQYVNNNMHIVYDLLYSIQ